MRKLTVGVLILMLAGLNLLDRGRGPLPALAAGPGCQDTTGSLVLEKVRTDASGPQLFGCINRSLDLLSQYAIINSTRAAIVWASIGRLSGLASSGGIYISSPTTVGSSMTITAPQGLAVTYGVSLGSAAVSSTFTANGAAVFNSTAIFNLPAQFAAPFQPYPRTNAQLALLTAPSSGYMVLNISTLELCVSSGSTVPTPAGAWILPSTTTVSANWKPCYTY